MIILVRESTRSILEVDVVSQSDFSGKGNEPKHRGRQIGKITRTVVETRNTFNDFTGRYKMTYKYGHR